MRFLSITPAVLMSCIATNSAVLVLDNVAHAWGYILHSLCSHFGCS